MIRYAKGPAPARLTALTTTPNMTWDGLGTDDRQPIRDALIRDQAALCAYCQRRIGSAQMKIEHWFARHPDGADLQLTWSNMLGVCLGRSARDRHCDENRGNRALFLQPVDGLGPDPREHLRYTKHGDVESTSPNPRVADDIRILNLNAYALTRARREVYDAFLDRWQRAGYGAQELRKLDRECEIRPSTAGREHAEFLRFHVRKKLRRAG